MNSSLIPATLAWLVSMAAACGGTIAFEGKSAFVVQGELPPVEVEAPKRVEQKGDKIVIREKVQFDLNRATIREESHGLLNEIAEFLNKKSGLKKVRVDGHASKDGPAAHNLYLSKRRARAVSEFLVNAGVDAERLTHEGYGERKPISDDPEVNRRVEFTIIEED